MRIYRRGDSTNWWFETTVAGRRIRKSTGTADRQAAQEIANEAERAALRSRIFGPESVATFAQAVNLYLDAGGEKRFLMKLLNHFGDALLSGIQPGHVRAAARQIYPSTGPATWNRQVITPVRAVINAAADHGLCPPLRVRAFPAPKPVRTAVTREWIEAFADACRSPYLAALARFMFQSGARISDAVSLRANDIDLMARTAHVTRTKNGEPHSYRITREMVLILANLPPKRGRVFGYASRHSVYGPWRTTCARAGITYVPPHQAGRHSFATEMIVRHGQDAKTAALLGNWKSTRLLMDTYVHPDGTCDVIEEVFGGGERVENERKAKE
jgi:integrase